MEQLKVNRVNGFAKGELTLKNDVSAPSKPIAAKLSIEGPAGAKESFDFDKFSNLNKLGATVVADSVAAADVATLETKVNELLAALRTAKVLAV